MAELVGQIVALLNSLMGHFVAGSIRFEILQDGEWVMYGGLQATPKLDRLTGAMADVIVYLMIGTDQLLQVLVGGTA